MGMLKVRIKTWEEMEKEFGLDKDEDIAFYPSFTHTMEELMPKDRIIEITKAGAFEWWQPRKNVYWAISEAMIAEYLPNIEKTQDEDYIENLEFENRMFAEFLESLGYSNEQISDISMIGNGFNQTNSGD